MDLHPQGQNDVSMKKGARGKGEKEPVIDFGQIPALEACCRGRLPRRAAKSKRTNRDLLWSREKGRKTLLNEYDEQ